MKKNIVCLLIGLMSMVFPSAVLAEGESHWQCEEYSFEYDMSMFISVYQQGIELGRWNELEIAAFSGDECRGVAVLEQVSDGPKYYYLRVRSNQSLDETITFKCFDSNANKEYTFPESVTFESLKRYGYPSQPFVLNLPFISVTNISLNKSALTLNVTQKEILTATILPIDATNKNISWSSSNEEIAIVNQNGEITAIKAGSVEIIVTSEDENLTAKCILTVLQPVTGISLNKTELTINVLEEETLSAIIAPADASNKNVTWSSSNESIATIDQTGKVKAIKAGSTTITVITDDGSFTSNCALTVKQPVTGISLNKSEITLNVGEDETLTAIILPTDASNQTIVWSISDEEIASIDQTGKVIGIKAGTTVITVISEDGGFTASCSISIIQPVTGIALNKSDITLNLGQKDTLIAMVLPDDASDKRVIWKTSDESIISVDQYGELLSLKEGQCIISVSTIDEQFSAECRVTVLPGTGVDNNSMGTMIYLVVGKDYLFVNGLVDKSVIAIIGTDGKLIKTISDVCSEDKIDISELTSGLYLISIKTSNNVVNRKFVREQF